MFFYLDFQHSKGAAIQICRLANEENLPVFPEPNTLYLQQGRQHLSTFEAPGGTFLLLGDPVFLLKENLFDRIFPGGGQLNEDLLFQEIKGHYYWFFLPDSTAPAQGDAARLLCGSGFGAIYPLYYAEENERVFVCSSSFALAEKTNADVKDKRNLLERLLFNYPFFNSTWWSGIHLLDAHKHLNISAGGLKVEGSFEVSQYFGAPGNASRDSLPDLAALFQKETELFFPAEPFAVSLTGGFDGRTLVAAAKKAGRSFKAYSFGRPDSTDVTMPARQAAKLGIPYFPIHLDNSYVEQHSYRSAWDFMRLTEFNGNFGRPHYHYAATVLAQQTNYILTGNFGSELFRALHLPGVMMSECLIRVFASTDDSWKDFLKQASQQWDKHFFLQETESLIADIEQYIGKMKDWEANHKFYYFVFNEIFRKYFGPELVMQSNYLNNRTPYLNLHFFKELNKTIWSGVHARLFEKVKSKRMKGQMFYATFIRQADPQLYRLNTNKGYSPADVLEPWRLPVLAGRVIWHKYLNNKEIDDNSVHAFMQRFHPQLVDKIEGNNGEIFRAMIEKSIEQVRQDDHMEGIVKLYSIAAGWKNAGEKIGAATHV